MSVALPGPQRTIPVPSEVKEDEDGLKGDRAPTPSMKRAVPSCTHDVNVMPLSAKPTAATRPCAESVGLVPTTAASLCTMHI